MSKPKPASALVRISAETIILARIEAPIAGRSLGAQVDYWARIGRAIEQSPGFSYERVKAALAGKLNQAKLTAEEDAVFFDQLGEAMAVPLDNELAFFEQMRIKGGAVGLDEAGHMVKGLPGGGTMRIDDERMQLATIVDEPVSAAEIERRQAVLSVARASSRTEGLEAHPQDAAVLDRFARGEITEAQAEALMHMRLARVSS